MPSGVGAGGLAEDDHGLHPRDEVVLQERGQELEKAPPIGRQECVILDALRDEDRLQEVGRRHLDALASVPLSLSWAAPFFGTSPFAGGSSGSSSRDWMLFLSVNRAASPLTTWSISTRLIGRLGFCAISYTRSLSASVNGDRRELVHPLEIEDVLGERVLEDLDRGDAARLGRVRRGRAGRGRGRLILVGLLRRRVLRLGRLPRRLRFRIGGLSRRRGRTDQEQEASEPA